MVTPQLPPDADPNPPSWLAAEVSAMQQTQDGDYNSALAIYSGACSNWVSTNMQNRALGKPVTAPPTPPQRVVIYAASGLRIAQFTAPVDPSLATPTLPPLATNNASVAFTTGAPQEASEIDLLPLIYGLCQRIAAKLGAFL